MKASSFIFWVSIHSHLNLHLGIGTVKTLMKNRKTYETTETAERNSVTSKRP